MPDLAHWYGDDLTLDARGDLLLASGLDQSNQHIVRRLMTVAGGYLWQASYGASVPSRIGETLDLNGLTAIIRHQMFLEAAVARQPEPEISVTPIFNGVYVSITYTNGLSSEQEQLAFEVTA